MSQPTRHLPLSGSAPHLPAAARAVGRPDAGQRLRVTLVLRPDPPDPGHEVHRKLERIRSELPHERPRLSASDLEALHAPSGSHLARVLAFARAHGLRVVATSAVRHDVVLEGSVGSLSAAFRVEVEEFEHEEGTFRAHREEVHLPEELHGIVVAVLGLHDVPLRRGRHLTASGGVSRLFTPAEIARIYEFPTRATGAGQRIAILAFGGGLDLADIEAYSGGAGANGGPRVHPIGVEGERNRSFDRDRLASIVAAMREDSMTQERLVELAGGAGPLTEALATVEATMDVEIAGGVAPGAEIDVYVTAASAHGFYWGVQAALGLADEGVSLHLPPTLSGAPGRPTVLSISWGDSEALWLPPEVEAMELALAKAAQLQVAVCCASGDLGSWTRPTDAADRPLPANVSFPASSPSVLAVGGTSLATSGDGHIEEERVWNATFLGQSMASGGGLSGIFPRPEYQTAIDLPEPPDGTVWVRPDRREIPGFRGRGVPDVAANADAASGFRILVAGQEGVGGGTSAAAPLWAGLLALIAGATAHSPGGLHHLLYSGRLSDGLRSIEDGDNDISVPDGVASFRAGPGWDACTGLGVPVGERLARALTGEA